VTETLSQRDIDALLQGATSAAPLAAAADVVPYNFIRPQRVSKDRRATLEAIYTRFALSLQALLSSRLRTPMDVVISSVEQVVFSEFVLSLGSPCAAFVFKMEDRLGAHGVIDLGARVSFQLVDRLFGGPGEPGDVERPLTSLEQTVVRSLIERALALLRDAWQDQLPMTPEIVAFESNPEMLQIANREDNVLVVNLEVRWGGGGGFVTLCLPMATCEPFLQERTAARPQGREGRGDLAATRPVIEACLQHARLSLSARLPPVWLTTREIVGLKAGQVIETGQPADAPIELHVNDRLRYLASLGQIRRRVGLRVSHMVSAPVAERPGRAREGRVS
jgi:flagellar motor switch protein FliM